MRAINIFQWEPSIFSSESHQYFLVRAINIFQWEPSIFSSESHQYFPVRAINIFQWEPSIFSSESHQYFPVRAINIFQWGPSIFSSESHQYFPVRAINIFQWEPSIFSSESHQYFLEAPVNTNKRILLLSAMIYFTVCGNHMINIILAAVFYECNNPFKTMLFIQGIKTMKFEIKSLVLHTGRKLSKLLCRNKSTHHE